MSSLDSFPALFVQDDACTRMTQDTVAESLGHRGVGQAAAEVDASRGPQQAAGLHLTEPSVRCSITRVLRKLGVEPSDATNARVWLARAHTDLAGQSVRDA